MVVVSGLFVDLSALARSGLLFLGHFYSNPSATSVTESLDTKIVISLHKTIDPRNSLDLDPILGSISYVLLSYTVKFHKKSLVISY